MAPFFFSFFFSIKDSETESKKISNSPSGDLKESHKKKRRKVLRSRFKGTIVPKVERQPLDLDGNPVSKDVLDSLMHFRKRQTAGNIDVWWLYDDGGIKSSKKDTG